MTGTQQDTPVSTILGDRLCVTCAYNLRGQPVEREPHYGLILARCPECNTPAALQEYPLLGRWPGRIRVLVALAYAMTVIAAFFASFGAMGGMASGLAELSVDGSAQSIAQRWADYVNTEEEADREPLKGSPLYNQLARGNDGLVIAYPWNMVSPDWWAAQGGRARLLGRVREIAAGNAALLALCALLMFTMGCAWAVLLLGARVRAILMFTLLPAGLLVSFVLAGMYLDRGPAGWESAHSLAHGELMPAGVALVTAMWMVFGWLGVWLGRPLARLGVRALLPPTLRGALAELWFTDGVALPTNTRAPRRLHPEAAPRGGGPGDAAHEHVRRPH